jgi:hypothetical protein
MDCDTSETHEVEAEVHSDQHGSSITVLFPRSKLRGHGRLLHRAEHTLSLYLQELLDIGAETEVVLRHLPDVVPDDADEDFLLNPVKRRSTKLRHSRALSTRISYLEVEIPAPEMDQDSIEHYGELPLPAAATNGAKTNTASFDGEWDVPQALLMEYVFQWNPLVAGESRFPFNRCQRIYSLLNLDAPDASSFNPIYIF